MRRARRAFPRAQREDERLERRVQPHDERHAQARVLRAVRAFQKKRGHLPGHVRGVVQRARRDVCDGRRRGGGGVQRPGLREAADEDVRGELLLPTEPVPEAAHRAHRVAPGVHPARAAT